MDEATVAAKTAAQSASDYEAVVEDVRPAAAAKRLMMFDRLQP